VAGVAQPLEQPLLRGVGERHDRIVAVQRDRDASTAGRVVAGRGAVAAGGVSVSAADDVGVTRHPTSAPIQFGQRGHGLELARGRLFLDAQHAVQADEKGSDLGRSAVTSPDASSAAEYSRRVAINRLRRASTGLRWHRSVEQRAVQLVRGRCRP
jgi:hypothetical protein